MAINTVFDPAGDNSSRWAQLVTALALRQISSRRRQIDPDAASAQ